MNVERKIIKKLGILLILLCLCFVIFPSNVNAKPKTVKIYSFSSGDQKVDKKVRSIIKKNITPDMNTAERVKTIHDYIVLNCKYDYSNYLNGTIPASSYSPKGVILKKKAVCQGYAEAFQLFMDALGIPCKTVIGSANNGSGYAGHAWNIVKIDKKWYQIDVSWDDPVPDQKGFVRYDYFLITDKKMKKDHRWSKSAYNKCKSGNDKFITLLGKVSDTMDSAADDFYKGYKADANQTATIIVHKKLYNSSDSFIFDLIYNAEAKYQEFITSFSYRKTTYGNYYIITIKVTGVEPSIY